MNYMVFVNIRSWHTKCAVCTPKHTLFSLQSELQDDIREEIKREDVMKQKTIKVLFFTINVLVPLVYGLFFYLIRRPGSIVTEAVTKLFPTVSFSNIGSALYFPFENHLADVLWAYVLTIVLSYFLDVKPAAITAVVFEVAIEAIQLIPKLNATFDILDIFFEVLATLLAVAVILLYRRICKDEKQQIIEDGQRIPDPHNVCRNGDGELE